MKRYKKRDKKILTRDKSHSNPIKIIFLHHCIKNNIGDQFDKLFQVKRDKRCRVKRDKRSRVKKNLFNNLKFQETMKNQIIIRKYHQFVSKQLNQFSVNLLKKILLNKFRGTYTNK